MIDVYISVLLTWSHEVHSSLFMDYLFRSYTMDEISNMSTFKYQTESLISQLTASIHQTGLFIFLSKTKWIWDAIGQLSTWIMRQGIIAVSHVTLSVLLTQEGECLKLLINHFGCEVNSTDSHVLTVKRHLYFVNYVKKCISMSQHFKSIIKEAIYRLWAKIH